MHKEYLDLFKSLVKSFDDASKGTLKKIECSKKLPRDMKSSIDDLNNLLTKYQNDVKDIDRELKNFIGENDNKINSLEKSKDTIISLSNLYKFKRDIEKSNTKDEMYEKLSKVLYNQFNLKNFNILELNFLQEKIQNVKSFGVSFYCKTHIRKNLHLYKFKNDKVVFSKYHLFCCDIKKQNKFPYCLYMKISKDIFLIINFVLENKEELEKFKNNIPIIQNYIKETSSSIERNILMKTLKDAAFKDILSSLYNRQFLEKYRPSIIKKADEEKYAIAVLLIDIDFFKAVNDEYGHDIGDKVIKEVSSALFKSIKDIDFAIRYGGEEFLIFLTNIHSEEDAIKIANRLRVNISKKDINVYENTSIRKTVSIGISMYPKDSKNFDIVLKNADIALYEAKRNGRNQVVRFNYEHGVDLF